MWRGPALSEAEGALARVSPTTKNARTINSNFENLSSRPRAKQGRRDPTTGGSADAV